MSEILTTQPSASTTKAVVDDSDDVDYDEIRRRLQSVVDQRRRRAALIRNVARLLVLVGFIALWNFVVGRWVDEFWVARPRAVWDRLWVWLGDGTIWHHLTYTAQAMFFGLVGGTLAGITLGFVLGSGRFLSEVFEPFVLLLYSIPKIAVAPLFILWFGIGLGSKILTSGIIVFFLVFYNTFSGVRSVDQTLIDAVRIMGARRRHVMTYVVLPGSAAWIYTGVSMAVPYSLIGAIVGEFIASSRGLGFLLRYSSGTFDTAGTFAALVVLALVGGVVNAGVRWHRGRTSGWMNQGSTGATP